MPTAFWLILAIAVITALLWYYEHKTVKLELALDSALDEIDRLVRDWAQPFNVVDHVMDDAEVREAFKLDEPPAFTRGEIEHWN